MTKHAIVALALVGAAALAGCMGEDEPPQEAAGNATAACEDHEHDTDVDATGDGVSVERRPVGCEEFEEA